MQTSKKTHTYPTLARPPAHTGTCTAGRLAQRFSRHYDTTALCAMENGPRSPLQSRAGENKGHSMLTAAALPASEGAKKTLICALSSTRTSSIFQPLQHILRSRAVLQETRQQHVTLKLTFSRSTHQRAPVHATQHRSRKRGLVEGTNTKILCPRLIQ